MTKADSAATLGRAVHLRTTTFADADAIARLCTRNQLGDADAAEWCRQWQEYPYTAEFQDVPIGWVLEAEDGSVVGSLNNLHMLYGYGGKRIKAVVAAGWAVDPEFRGKALQLMTTFLRQPHVDLWLNVSATPGTAQILTAMKIPRIPIPDYATPCFWPIRRRAFARAALLRRSVPAAALLAWPAGLAALARDIYLRSGRCTPVSSIRRLPDFDERFDRLSHGTETSPPQLRAVRDRAVLAWRFRSAIRSGRGTIVIAERGSALLGYAILVRRAGSGLDMELCEVADLQAGGDDPSTFRDLLLGSIKIAREEGADAVKFMSGTPVKRTPAEALHPYTYRLPVWQLYFKTASAELTRKLSNGDAWDFSWFDTF